MYIKIHLYNVFEYIIETREQFVPKKKNWLPGKLQRILFLQNSYLLLNAKIHLYLVDV